MAVHFAPWTGADHCTSGARPGARALMKVILDEFSGVANWGIYNCRNVVGGSTTSAHGEGRALDVGCSLAAGRHLVAELLDANPERLGIQAIIHDRQIWSAKSPDGRRYSGLNPHRDHVHIELTRGAADSLTVSKVRAILAPKPDKPKPPAKGGGMYTVKSGDTLSAIAAANGTTVEAFVKANDIADPDVITVGQKLTIPGKAKSKRETVSLARIQRAARRDPRAPSDTFTAQADVMVVEHALKAEGLLDKPWVDGHFGTLTIRAYSAWQRRCGYSGQDADGVPGEASLTKLGKAHGFDVKN